MFCRYWRITPRDVDGLHPEEHAAMDRYMRRDLREQARQARRSGRR